MRRERVNLRFPRQALSDLDELAGQLGETRTAVFVHAAALLLAAAKDMPEPPVSLLDITCGLKFTTEQQEKRPF